MRRTSRSIDRGREDQMCSDVQGREGTINMKAAGETVR